MKNILKALAVALLMAATVIPATAKKPFLSEKEQAKIEKAAEKEAELERKQNSQILQELLQQLLENKEDLKTVYPTT